MYPRPAGIDQLYQRNYLSLNQGFIERANSLVNLINLAVTTLNIFANIYNRLQQAEIVPFID